MLAVDPGETNDLSVQYPEMLSELKEVWGQKSKEVGVVPG